MKRIILMGVVLLIAFTTKAQQDPLISNYKFNYFVSNPAAAGSEHSWALKAGMRNQWNGLPGNPLTGHFTAHTIFGRVGVGLDFFTDVIGPWETYGASMGYAYHIPMGGEGETSGFSLGIGARAMRVTANEDLIVTNVPGDPATMGIEDELVADLIFGVYYYSEGLYAGVSVPQLVQLSNKEALELDRHYYIMAGYKIELSDDFTLDPSVMLKYVGNTPFNYEANLQGWFIKEQLMFGVGYRADGFISAQTGFKVNERYKFTYAYDLALNNTLQNHSNGSHEVMIGYNFGFRNK